MPLGKNIIQKTYTLALAVICGTKVSNERLLRRIAICAECPQVKKTLEGTMRCGVCGCNLKGDRSIVNLALYEETDNYGCKYKKGSRWKKAGV